MWIAESAGTVTLEVRVQPRASSSRVVGVEGDRLKIALTAPPVDGKANDALLRFVAEALEVPRRSIEIVRGQTGRNKTLRVAGVSKAAVERWAAGHG